MMHNGIDSCCMYTYTARLIKPRPSWKLKLLSHFTLCKAIPKQHCKAPITRDFDFSQAGLYVKLELGQERGFFIDDSPLTHAFNPCGHVTTKKSTE